MSDAPSATQYHVRLDDCRWMPDPPPGACFAAGLFHKMGLIIPEWEMVIIRTGSDRNPDNGHHGALNDLMRVLSPAVS